MVIKGELDVAGASQVDSVPRHSADVVVDVRAMTFVDAAGLAALMRLLSDAQGAGAKCAWRGKPSCLMRVLAMLDMVDAFEFETSLDGQGEGPALARSVEAGVGSTDTATTAKGDATEDDWQFDKREFVANEREWIADQRERIADQRERIADERERIADERERVADERDRRAARPDDDDAAVRLAAAAARAKAGTFQLAAVRRRLEVDRVTQEARLASAYEAPLAAEFGRLARHFAGAKTLDDCLAAVVASSEALVDGCTVASISMVERTQVRTRASTGALATEVDEIQYRSGEGGLPPKTWRVADS